jgi:hypothetical protein
VSSRRTAQQDGQEGSCGERNGTKMKNFLDALVAVLAGNAIYYLLMPHLPDAVRHGLFKEDLGLLLDFAICSMIFVIVKYARRNEEEK